MIVADSKDWKKEIAAAKATRKTPYTIASVVIGALLHSKMIVPVTKACGSLGLMAAADGTGVCGVSEAQLTLGLLPVIVAATDWLVQFGRNVLKHRLGVRLP